MLGEFNFLLRVFPGLRDFAVGLFRLFLTLPGMTQNPPTPDRIALQADLLEVGAALEFVAAAEAGGINAFLGTTRAQAGADGRRLTALDYEAYREMVEQQLTDLARRARQRWPI